MELVIVLTPIEVFQKDLLGKKKGHSIDIVLQDRRKYKAIVARQQHLKSLGTANSIMTITRSKCANKLCGKCGLSHSRQHFPAFRDLFKAYIAKRHWTCQCKKSGSKDAARSHSKTQTYRRQAQQNDNSSKESTKNLCKCKPIHEVHSETDLKQDSMRSNSQPEDEQAFHIVNLTHQVDEVKQLEAFAAINITRPKKAGKYTLKLKIDIGASANILPIQILKDMYWSRWKSMIQLPGYVHTTGHPFLAGAY
ncbi:uncharacterized protein [Heterodontus francisci]|uniref:uncharacterized protein n=1 Tax=Heterodontus francisci TaxID=7792 RepID=UPI00355B138E